MKTKGKKLFAEQQAFRWLGVALLIMNDWSTCRSTGLIFLAEGLYCETVSACNTAITLSYS